MVSLPQQHIFRQKQAASFYWTKKQHGFVTYFHVGQLLFADKKYLLLKRITVQTREKTLLRNTKSKKPLYCHAPTLLLAEGSSANIAPPPSRLLPP
jgi:hypothetical protein